MVKPYLERAAEIAAQATAHGESYNDLFNALQRIDTAAVALPGFEVRHEGGLDAVVKNIVEAIGRCAAQTPAVVAPANQQSIATTLREQGERERTYELQDAFNRAAQIVERMGK